MDNSTCWDARVDCVDDGAATAGVFFLETVNDHRGAKGGDTYNLEISGVQDGDTLLIGLNAGSGGGWGVQNISAPFGTVGADHRDAWNNYYSDDGSFSVSVPDDAVFGELFQISVTAQPGNTE